MTDRADLAVLVLAGGASRRFGRDKLAEPIDGVPLLARAIEAVRRMSDECLVVVGRDAAPPLPPGVRAVPDRWAGEGPLAGLVSGLAATDRATAIVVGGDMPRLVAPVLALLVEALDTDPTAVVAVLDSDDGPRPLPLALRRHQAVEPLERAVETGERRLRAVQTLLSTTVVTRDRWRGIDPAGDTLVDVDTPDDLGRATGA